MSTFSDVNPRQLRTVLNGRLLHEGMRLHEAEEEDWNEVSDELWRLGTLDADEARHVWTWSSLAAKTQALRGCKLATRSLVERLPSCVSKLKRDRRKRDLVLIRTRRKPYSA